MIGGPLPLSLVEIAVTAVLTATVMALLAYRLVNRFVDRPAEPSPARDRSRRSAQFVDSAPPHGSPPPDDGDDVLPDADRVIHLLDASGGQLRQVRIVEETGWSKSKVSRLLSRMEDRARIEKISLGRENLIALPEAEPMIEDGGE